MCYNPITIINPSKYVDVNRNDRFLIQVPCGKCVECQSVKSREWHLRTYYEFLNTYQYSENSYVYWDTLTYDPDHLPYMDHILSSLPHLPCFNSKHIQDFLKNLRIKLSRKFGLTDNAFSYFVCSEYGSLKHRPHYHIMFFIRKYVDPIQLSYLVSQTWKYGRTDGMPYKSALYVLRHNTLEHSPTGNVLATSQYVTKYVEKDCKLQGLIDSRIKQAELVLSQDQFLKNNSVKYRKLLTKIAGEVDQFHLQSLHYGENLLRDLDINELAETGCVRMPSFNVVDMVPLPMYFLRKIIYERYKFNNAYGWQLTDFGKEFKKKRLISLTRQITDRLKALQALAGTDYDIAILVDYVVNRRGRYRSASLPESTLCDRVNTLTHYVYVTQTDKESIGCGVTTDFLGTSQLGYLPFNSSNLIKIKDFIEKYVYIDDVLEKQLKVLYSSTQLIDDGMQKYHARIQELRALFTID